MKIMLHEFMAQWELDHPHIVPLLGLSQPEDGRSVACGIFPWYPRGTLDKYLQEEGSSATGHLYAWVRLFHSLSSNSHFPLFQVGQLIDGMHYLHTRQIPVIHGDLRTVSVLLQCIIICMRDS
jgi:serine/threonine protein kinase